MTEAGTNVIVGEDEENQSNFEKFTNKFCDGVCGVLFVMSKETAASSTTAMGGILIDFLQMLAFHFYGHIAWKWNSPATSWLSAITNAFRLYSFIEDDSMLSTARIVFYLCFALVALTLIDAIWVGYQFSQQRIRFIFTVKFLRFVSEVVIGPLYIPIVAIFTMQLPCHSKANCWSDAAHIFPAVCAALIGCLYIALSITLTGSFYSRDPIAAITSALARPTSRVMMAQLGVKTALTIFFILLYPFDSARWFLLALLAAGTSGLACLYTLHLPYFRFEFNVARACTFWILSWASLCLIITELSGADAAQFSGTSLLFLMGSPLVAAAAYMATQYRKMHIMRLTLTEIESPAEIELKARFMLENLTEVRSHRTLGLSQLPAPSTTSGISTHKVSADLDLNESSSAAPETENGSSVRIAQRRLELLEEAKLLADETSIIEQADAIYAFGIGRFGNSCSMHLLRAQFCFFYHEHKTVALSHLTRAESRAPALDEAFSIYLLRKSAHESMSGADGNDIIAYIQLQKALADANKFDEASARHTLAFWDVLLQSQPDLGQMNDLSKKINHSMNLAHQSFKQLMRLNANSIPVLRQYAGFLLDLANEPEQARVMLARADELEDELSKQHADGLLDTNSFNDRQAVISVSADPKTLGRVMQVNPVAMRLLGYSKAELIGRNIAVIVPAPFAAHHQGYLKHYTDSGSSSIMSRPAWALHKSGHLVPLNLFVREISSETSHVFLAALKEVVSPFEMGFLNADLHLFGCTALLGSALSVPVVEMHAGSLHLSRWIHNLESVKGELLTPEGFEFSLPQEGSGMHFTMRLWLSTLHVTGEPRNWYLMRAQLTLPSQSATASSHGITASAAPARFISDDDRKENEEEDEEDAIVDDDGSDESGNDSFQSDSISYLVEESRTISVDLKVVSATNASESRSSNKPALPTLISPPAPKAGSRIIYENSALDSGQTLAAPVANIRSPMALETTSPSAKSIGQVARVRRVGAGVSREAMLPLLSPNASASHHLDGVAVIRTAASAENGSVHGSSASRSTLSVHTKFRGFSRSRDSHKLSSSLRSLQVALTLALGFIVFASILRFFVIKSSVAEYVSALNSISKSGLIRVLPTTFSMLVLRLILTRMGFYQSYSTDAIRAQMKPLLEQFSSYSQDLYLGSSRAQVAANDALRGLWEHSKLAFNTLQAGVWAQPRRSLWDATQSLQTAVTSIMSEEDSKVEFTDDHVFWVLLNADDALLTALNRSTFLYQYETLREYEHLTVTSATLAITPVVFLLLVIVLLVRPIVVKIEQNKFEVLEHFLDIPLPLLSVFRARILRRVAMHENAEDGACADPNVVEEEDEAVVISNIVLEQHDDDAAALASGQESSSAQRRNRERHAKARAVMLESGFLRRHSTMLKICGFWVLSIIYFAPTYTEFFGKFRASLLSKPHQVNIASYGTLQMRVVSAHLVEMLTQNYTTTYAQGPTLEQNPAMTVRQVQGEIDFSYEIITALGMGSEYYGTLAPENDEQARINFQNACFATPAADCATFADRALTHGLYAAYLDWADKASLVLKMVTKSVAESAAVAAALASSGLNATTLRAAQQAAQFAIINATLNSLPLTQLLKLDYDYLAPATTIATLQYANAPTATFASIATPKSVALAIWILITAAVHLFFFRPLVYKLHDEHHRTTSMLLMISPDVMEKIASIRAFVLKLSTSNAHT